MSGDVTERITAVRRQHRCNQNNGTCSCGHRYTDVATIADDHAEHVAEAVAAELASWDFLMELLNEHYPEDVFPTIEERADRDPGPRIVSLIRHLDAARRVAVGEPTQETKHPNAFDPQCICGWYPKPYVIGGETLEEHQRWCLIAKDQPPGEPTQETP